MRKIKFLISFAVSLLLLLSFNVTALASNDIAVLISDKKIISENPIEILTDFTEKFPNRTAGTPNELNAANYLADILKKYNLTSATGDYLQKFNIERTDANNLTKIIYSQNVQGTYLSKKPNAKKVIIGAHYDNVFKESEDKKLSSSGSYDNASGVTAVLMLLEQITKSEYDFDIEFVFFGSEEIGQIGSRKYIASLDDKQKDDILLMVNLDSLICGDYLYLYTNEKPMPHQEMFFDVATKDGLNLRQVPKDKRVTSFSGLLYKPFSHVGQMTDSEPFVNAEIPVVSLFGYNMESSDRLMSVESDSKSNIMHTPNDNVSKIIEVYGESFVLGRLNDAKNVVLNTISKSDFIANMEFSKQNSSVNLNFYNITYNAIVLTVCFLIFAAVMVLMVTKVSKEKSSEVKPIAGEFYSIDVFGADPNNKKTDEFNKAKQTPEDLFVFGEEFEDKNKKK